MLSDWIYWFLQKIDKSYTIARIAKTSSKQYLHCSEIVEHEAKEYAAKNKCDFICCGHTHFALDKGTYFNSGTWTEKPCSYLTVKDGQIHLRWQK